MKKSPGKGRLIWGLLTVLLVGGIGIFWRVQSASILTRASIALEQLGFQSPRFVDVSISLWDGLRFEGVEAELAEAQPGSGPGPRVGFDRATIALDWLALLRGAVQPTAVHVHHAFIRFVHPPSGDFGGWRLDHSRGVRHAGPLLRMMPSLRVDLLKVQALAERGEETLLTRHWEFAIDGAVGAADSGYRLTFRQVGGAAVSDHASDRPLAQADWDGQRVTISTDWLDSEALSPLLPAELSAALRDWAARGRLRLDELVIDAGGARSARATFEAADVALPLEGASTPPLERFAQLRDARGFVQLKIREGDASKVAPRLDLVAEARGNAPPGRFELRVEAQDIDGARGLNPSAARGKFSLIGRLEEAQFPTQGDQPRLFASEALPEPIEAFLRDYQPTGRFSLQIELERAGVDRSPRFRGEMRPHGATCRYFRFPYEMRDATGVVRFSDDGIELLGLLARHGSARIRADGHVNHSGPWTGFDLRFTGTGVALEQDLYAALPREYQRLWDEAWPIGLCDLTAELKRGEGSREHGSKEPEIRVDARLLAGGLSAPGLARLTHAGGDIRVEHDTLEIRGLSGMAGDRASLTLDGFVTLPRPGRPGGQDMSIIAANYALEKTSTVRGACGQSLGDVAVRAAADAWGRMLRSGDVEQAGYVLRLREGTTWALADPLPWTSLQGWLTSNNGDVVLHDVEARRGAASLSASGTLRESQRCFELDLSASDAELAALLPSLVPECWSHIRDGLGLSGAGAIEGKLRAAAGEFGADLQIDASRLKPRLLPLELRDARATLSLGEAGFELRDARAACAEGGAVVLRGSGRWGPPMACELAGELTAIPLTPTVIAALPPATESLLRTLCARGTLDARLDRARFGGSEGSEWIGALHLRGASLELGVPLTDFVGEVGGRLALNGAGQATLECDFSIASGALDGRAIRDWSGRLRREPGDPLLRITDITGSMCGGTVSGEALIDPATTAYEISLALHDVELSEFLRLKNVNAGEAGRVDGRVFARGRSDTPGSRSGGGDLRVRGAKWLGSKVGSKLAQARRERNQAVGDDIDSVLLRFVWSGAELRFNHVDIQSRDLRMVGSGVWNTSTDVISLTLLGANPRDAARLAVVSDLLELAGRELAQYRVEGVVAAPRVTVEPLHNLTEPLRNLARELARERP